MKSEELSKVRYLLRKGIYCFGDVSGYEAYIKSTNDVLQATTSRKGQMCW